LSGPRRTDAEIERDKFVRYVDMLDTHILVEAGNHSDAAITTEQKAFAIETMEETVTRLQKMVDRLRALR
jgi:hypothetical protein